MSNWLTMGFVVGYVIAAIALYRALTWTVKQMQASTRRMRAACLLLALAWPVALVLAVVANVLGRNGPPNPFARSSVASSQRVKT